MLRRLIAPYVTWFALASASWHSAAASLAAQTLVAVAVMLAGQGLGAKSFGQMMAIAAFYGWFRLLAGYATHAFLPKYLADDAHTREEKARACATAFWLSVTLTAISVATALVLLPWALQALGLSALGAVGALYAGVFALTYLKLALDAISQVAGWLRRWSISNLVGAALPVLLLGATVIGRHSITPYQYTFLLFLAGAMGTGFAVYLLAGMLGGGRGLLPSPGLVKPVMVAGIGPWLASLSVVLSWFGSQTVIARYLPKEDLGFFSAGMAFIIWISSLVHAVAVPAMAEWSRLAARRRIADLRRDLRRRQFATGVVMGTAALLVCIFAEPLLRGLYGQDFAVAAPLLRLMTVQLVLTGVGEWYCHCMFAIGQPKRVALPNLVCGVPTLLFTYLAIRYGQAGIFGVTLIKITLDFLWLALCEWEFRRAFREEIRAGQVEDTEVAMQEQASG